MNTELLKLIGELTEDVVFKVKNASLYGIAHGSSDGGVVEVEQYWNTYTCSWTTKEAVIESHIMNKLKPYIKEAIKTK